MADAAEGDSDAALKGLTSAAADDPQFVRSDLHLFRDSLSADQAKALVAQARQQQDTGNASVDLGSIIEQTFLSNDRSPDTGIDEAGASQLTQERGPADAGVAWGEYTACDQALKPEQQSLHSAHFKLLASCAFCTGDFLTTSKAADRLKATPATLIYVASSACGFFSIST